MSEGRGLEALQDFKGSPRPTIAKLLRQLAVEMKLEREAVHGVEVREIAATTDAGERVRVPRAFIHRRKRPRITIDSPLLVIDADADERIGRQIFGDGLRHVSLPVRRNATVCQVADLRFSKSSLLPPEGMGARDVKTVGRRLDKVRRFIHALVALHPPIKVAGGAGRPCVLVVASKAVRCALTGESRAGTLPAGIDWEGATIANFGNIRGIDAWKGYDAVVTIGREQLWPNDAEAMARALYCDDSAPLALAGEYADKPRGYRLSGGRQLGTAAPVLADDRAQRLHELIREREIVQAVDRLRLVHRERPAKVFILGSLPVDLSVDRLVDFDGELLRLELEAARSRWGGVLPLVPDWIVANEPALFGAAGDNPATEKAVKRALQSAGILAGDMARSPYIESYMESGPYPKPVEFNVAGRPGRPLKTLAEPCHYGGALLLRRAMGAPISKIDGLPRSKNFAFAGWPRAWGPTPDADSPLWDPEIAKAAVVCLRDRERLAEATRSLSGCAFQAVLPVRGEIVFRLDATG
jgi:hypothetical protein